MKGTSSYFNGLQAGYNYWLRSRIMLGFEADLSAPQPDRRQLRDFLGLKLDPAASAAVLAA
jgi:hypothetical protein